MKISIITLIILTFFTGLKAQDKTTPLDSDNLNNQFQYIITKTEKFEQYQVVKRSLLQKLKSNTLDSIKALKQTQSDLESEVSNLKSELTAIKSRLNETQEKLDTSIKEKGSLKFFGVLIKKGTYYFIISIIIIALIAGIVVIFFLYKRSNVITLKTKETLEHTQEEFEKHRKWALEKEQQLSRELLKEKQKNKGLI